MLPTVARIFVSSTWLDLQPERHAVEDAINRMNSGKFVGERLTTASLSAERAGAQPQPGRAWCCVNGKIENLDARERRRREGESYPDEASARIGCRPIR